MPTSDIELKPLISPRAAAEWFLHDMAEVSGFLLSGFENISPLSVYGSYRPVLTKPDPWYYAGVVALETSAITDLFLPEGADDILRGIFDQMDTVIGRDDKEASALTMLLLGRLGLGSVLMGRKVPDNMLSKMMLMLIGSDKAMKRVMPDPTAHKQLQAALKSGKPIWWKMFARRYRLTTAPNAAVSAKLVVPMSTSSPLQNVIPDPALDPGSETDVGLPLNALREALVMADLDLPAAAEIEEAEKPLDDIKLEDYRVD